MMSIDLLALRMAVSTGPTPLPGCTMRFIGVLSWNYLSTTRTRFAPGDFPANTQVAGPPLAAWAKRDTSL